MYGLLSTETFSVFALFPNLIKSNYNREQRKTEIPGLTRPSNGSSSINDRSLSDISNECVGFDMTRGELVLFEHEAIFIGSIFKLATQFYILQGIKVINKEFILLTFIAIVMNLFLGILCYAGVYHTLPSFNGLENICSAFHLRRHCNLC